MALNSLEHSRRIAKNTLLLYFRMAITMMVSLYTSRVILNTLGVEDFGIYNIVGSIIGILGFLNGAMSATAQRYLTLELGKGNYKKLQQVFSSCLFIHILLAVLVIVVSETLGLWLLRNKIQIPIERIDAAFWVFQASVLASVIMILSVPYNSVIIAHEKMSAFAYISVLEVILKLVIVYLLAFFPVDKLILYAILIVIVQLFIRLCYGWYCKRHFPETAFKFCYDRILVKEMMGFTGWNLFGNLAGVVCTQGLNVLLSIFFNPVINAARGISVQVQNAINQFAYNFQTAMNPQITKSYAVGDFSYMHILIEKSGKLTFFLLLFLSLPVFFETQSLLSLWLKTVPDYTVPFLRLMLCTTIVDAVANPLMIAASATGNVKFYQSIVGGLLILILPVSYVALKIGGEPISVFVVHVVICIIAFGVRLFIVRPLIHLSIRSYLKNTLWKCFLVSIVSITSTFLFKIFSASWNNLFLTCLFSMFSVFLSVYFGGLDASERKFVKERGTIWLHKLMK